MGGERRLEKRKSENKLRKNIYIWEKIQKYFLDMFVIFSNYVHGKHAIKGEECIYCKINIKHINKHTTKTDESFEFCSTCTKRRCFLLDVKLPLPSCLYFIRFFVPKKYFLISFSLKSIVIKLVQHLLFINLD